MPLPALVAALLSMRSSSQQSMLDAFFGNLCADGALCRAVSDRAFAKARSHLHAPALAWLNAQLLQQADSAGLVPRWQGLRLVAVHSGAESERAMLAEALDKLDPGDVLLLDRGYPAAWLVHLLNARGIGFVMRCDTTSGGWKALRGFTRGTLPEATITLSRPAPRDVQAWGCPAVAPSVRVVRQISPGGAVRVLLAVGDVLALLDDALRMIARSRRRVVRGRSTPRPPRRVKPHPHLACKGAGA